MHNQHRCIDEFSKRNSAIRSFRLHELRPRSSVVFRLKQPLFFEFISHPGKNVAVFGMDHCRNTILPRCEKDVEDLVVAQLEGFVGHVDF